MAPTIPHHCSDEFILGCAALAREFDLGLHSHVAESKIQAVTGIRVYGETQTAHLDRLGVLGPHFTVAHGVWLGNDDMARLGDHGASVAHNPGSNMRLGSGLADTRAMLERHVNLAIGTDGAGCSDNQNMYEAMRLGSFVSKVQGPDTERWLTTREAALAATEGSARALGFGDRIGHIAPGYKADLVFLDLDHPNWMPFNDPINQLVHCEDGTAVESVMVGGRMVVADRRVLTVDLARLRDRRPSLARPPPASQPTPTNPPALRSADASCRQPLPGARALALSRTPLRGAAGIAPMKRAAAAGDRNTYARYLQLKKLLSSQVTRTGSEDELLFIIMHQSHELWFKLAIHELASATRALILGVSGKDCLKAVKRLSRVTEIQRLLIHSWDVLTTLTPDEFFPFSRQTTVGRDGASGFPVRAVHRIFEFRLGLKYRSINAIENAGRGADAVGRGRGRDATRPRGAQGGAGGALDLRRDG